MASFGQCCCSNQCLCDSAWNIASFELSVFGADFSGTLSPAEFDAESCERTGVACQYDVPELVLDVLYDFGAVGGGAPPIGQFNCFCGICDGPVTISRWSETVYQADREVVWHQVQRFATISIQQCETDSKFKIVVSVIFSATRIQSALSKEVWGRQLWLSDCVGGVAGTPYPFGSVEFPCGSDYLDVELPPLPPNWPQLEEDESPCDIETGPPALPAAITDAARTYTAPRCAGFFVPCTTQNITESPTPRCIRIGKPFFGPVVCNYGLPQTADYVAERKQVTVVWESDCLDCSEISDLAPPVEIALNRVSITPPPPGSPGPTDVTWNLFSAVTGTSALVSCATVPALPITVPYSIVVTLS